MKIYLFTAIVHNSGTAEGGKADGTGMHAYTSIHTHLCTHTRGTYKLNLVSQTEFLILSLGIIVRMW